MDKLTELLKDDKRRSSLESRFWSKIKKNNTNECWPWIAKSKTSFGYGVMNAGRGNGTFKSNRVAYALLKGDLKDGMCVLHSCDNPSCCNPNHLRLGTKKDNTLDAVKRKRLKKPPVYFGENHHNTKLTSCDIDNIIESEENYQKLSDKYNVSYKTIYRIKKNKTWINHETIRKRNGISS